MNGLGLRVAESWLSTSKFGGQAPRGRARKILIVSGWLGRAGTTVVSEADRLRRYLGAAQ